MKIAKQTYEEPVVLVYSLQEVSPILASSTTINDWGTDDIPIM